jgi:di/tricarboxylate transporter
LHTELAARSVSALRSISRRGPEANALWLLSGFFYLTGTLTQPILNQAVSAAIQAIAIQTAQNTGLNLRGLSMMVAVAHSFATVSRVNGKWARS